MIALIALAYEMLLWSLAVRQGSNTKRSATMQLKPRSDTMLARFYSLPWFKNLHSFNGLSSSTNA